MRQWTANELNQLKELRRDCAPGEIALLLNIEVKDVMDMISFQQCVEREEMMRKRAEKLTKEQSLPKYIHRSPDMMGKLRDMYESESKERLEKVFNMPYRRIAARAQAAGFRRKLKDSKGRRDSWTSEEVKILQDNYPNMTVSQIVELLPNRSLKGIAWKAKKMGLVCLVVKKKESVLWTKSEEDVLRRMYPSASWSDIKKALPNRSTQSIRHHALYVLGVSREL